VPQGTGSRAEAFVASPAIRVAIQTEASRVSVGADSGVVAWVDGISLALPRATLHSTAVASRYRVQVASLMDEPAASGVAQRARSATGESVSVRRSDETGTYQVRVGSYDSREAALALAARLAHAGLSGGFVATEAPAGSPSALRLLEAERSTTSALLIAPARSGEELWVDGAAYRGVLEALPGQEGGFTLVNVVGLEDYLRGVVPNELSPAAYPQIEALKAQAIAARSYALNHMGQFAAKGYDICATPACQVYRGRGSEQALTDQAVLETRGLVAAAAGGQPVNALYTSTCGGHTEDAANVFEGQPASYLRGVACQPERSAWSFVRTLAQPRRLGEAPGLGRDLALLEALGVLEPSSAAGMAAAATEDELRRATARLLVALHRKGCAAAPGSIATRGAFFNHLVRSLCWEERAERLLAPGDEEYLLQVEDRTELVDDDVRRSAALLVQEGLLVPDPENRLRPGQALTAAEAIALLAGVASKVGPPGLQAGEFRGLEEGQLTVALPDGSYTYPLDREARLFRALDGGRFWTSELSLITGDPVRFVVRDGRVAYLEAEQSRLGPSADRTSRYYRWEVRLTPEEVGTLVARYGQVGRVRDLVPRRLGVSGRVVELAVLGSDGELLLNGLKVRWALGLRENLFVIDRELRPDGSVARFVITGKGWGHGVGLCQVGASGLAQTGAKAEAILKHYYTGVSIVRAY
jgi:stage II sporulation protein D